MLCWSHLVLGPSLNGMLVSPCAGPIIKWYAILTSGSAHYWMRCSSYLWFSPYLNGMVFLPLDGPAIELYLWFYHIWLGPSLNGLLFSCHQVESIIDWYVQCSCFWLVISVSMIFVHFSKNISPKLAAWPMVFLTPLSGYNYSINKIS